MTRLAVLTLVALTVTSCNKSTPTSPSPPTGGTPPTTTSVPPTTTVPPTTPTRFIIDGRVREEAPTSGQFVQGATVSIVSGGSTGTSTTADGNAYYVFNNIEGGTFNVELSRSGFVTRQTAVSNLTANRSIDFFLKPVLRILDEQFTGQISGGDTRCTTRLGQQPCRTFTFGVHYSDNLEATLRWGSRSNDLDLDLYDGSGNRLATSGQVVTTDERLSARVQEGGTYQLRVYYWMGSTIENFTLSVRRPN